MKIRFGIAIFGGLTITGCLVYTPGVCKDACDRIYEPSQCGIERPGATTEEMVRRCERQCAYAFSRGGSIGAYEPNEQTPVSETPLLENRSQVLAWAECVENTACEDLMQNYCAPIW